MIKMIEAESKANCETCQVNSDSQFDHCRSGELFGWGCQPVWFVLGSSISEDQNWYSDECFWSSS